MCIYWSVQALLPWSVYLRGLHGVMVSQSTRGSEVHIAEQAQCWVTGRELLLESHPNCGGNRHIYVIRGCENYMSSAQCLPRVCHTEGVQ